MNFCIQPMNVIYGSPKGQRSKVKYFDFFSNFHKNNLCNFSSHNFYHSDQCIYRHSDILHRKAILHCFTVTLKSHLATKIGQSSNSDLMFLINISRSE